MKDDDPMWKPRARWFGWGLGVSVGLASLVAARSAAAGMFTTLALSAVTPDGSHIAIHGSRDGTNDFGCGLTKADTLLTAKEPGAAETVVFVVPARCTSLPDGSFSPASQWEWSARPALVRSLLEFDSDQKRLAARVRTVFDRDTRLPRIELFREGQWYPVRANEVSAIAEVPLELRYGAPETSGTGTWSELNGFVRSGDVSFVRLAHYRTLVAWDELIVVPDAELSPAATANRQRRFRAQAVASTRALREAQALQKGVFKPAAHTARNRLRRNDAVRAALHEWEQAAAFGPLGSAELQDALWLLAWLEAPTRRLEALRMFTSFRERDATAASALLAQLAADQPTAGLATYLAQARDPLRNLPEVSGHTITDAELAPLSNDELRWVHLAQWAAQGCYRFDDPAIEAYFSQFPWYSPIPKQRWRWQRAQPFMKNPDAPLLKMQRSSTPADARKESLEAILRAESARGLTPPRLGR